MKHRVILGIGVIIILLSVNITGLAAWNNFESDQNILYTRSPNDNIFGAQIHNNPPRATETIVINEFMPDPASDWDGDLLYDYSDDEWVELYKYGAQPVDISGWNISDSSAKRYSIATGVIIAPNGFYLMFGSNQSLSLNNNGDTIKLLNATDSILDTYTYTSSYDDISIGRRPDGTDNWTEFNEPTPGQSNGGLPRIVINEVMYNPAGSDSENEWLELFNNDTRTINITSWRLSDQDGLVDYIFKTGDFPFVQFPPQTYLVVHSGNGEDEVDFSDGSAHLYMSLTTAMLNNDGDDILFSDRGFFCIDYIAYGESSMIDPPPNPSAWDGTWYDSGGDVYIKDKPNPVADHDCTIQLINNGQDDNTVLGWGNASGPEITQGRNNNEIIGLEVACENNVNYLNTGEEAIFNISILNTGNIQLNLEINTTEVPTWWVVQLSDTKITVTKKTKTNITITIVAPDN
ncbi:MAG: lamin tail domain-containing protein, partial [Thermoplasmata archaeon]|nr:lamin tail domain-containing protein [Thermoplasmata archaeon]